MFFNPGNISNSGNGGTGGSGDGHTHSNLSTLNKVTESKLREWDNKSNFSGNYNDLTNKPTIPTVDVTKVYVDSEVSKKADKTHSHSEYATPSYVQEKIAEASLSGGEVDLSAYATKAELNTKADKTHSHNELHSHSNKTVLDGITSSKVNEWNNKSTFNGDYNSLTNKPVIPSTEGLATETYVNNKIIPNLVGNTVTNKTLTLTVDKYQYAVLSNGDSIALPSVSSFTEIHLFFKASADLTLTFPSVRWQSIPSITSGHTYEIIFTYVVDEWLAGVICYE